MKITIIAVAVSAMAAAGSVTSAVDPVPTGGDVPPSTAGTPSARLPGFAAELSDQPRIQGPEAWKPLADAAAWAAIARSTVDTRQAARWAYARSLLGRGRAAEAYGVLQVMGADDPDLVLIDSYRLARGAALVSMRRPLEGMEALVGPGLAGNPEACAWRLLALAEEKLSTEALQQLDCARPALAARPNRQREPFLLAAAKSALAVSKPQLAISLLQSLGKSHPAANLLRGSAFAALGQKQQARLVLARAEKNGSLEQRLAAELGRIEAAVQGGAMTPAAALKRLSQIRYSWRGGDVEEHALRLSYRIGSDIGDLRAALSAGSTLFNYFNLGADGGALMLGLQTQLAAALDPQSRLPLDQALGLYWDYRDLTPMGAEGDLLVSRLGERLQAAGLYARAADLFEHQLFARARDLAQGPLSAKVARLHILAGRADRALDAIRRTSANPYPAEMQWERYRVEAVALSQLGKAEEALAILDAVPDSAGLRSEILWKKRDWAALADTLAPTLPADSRMSEVNQASILRYAIALAMLRREPALQSLRARYGDAFAGLATGPAFDLLTGGTEPIDPDALTKAMASIPSASPAGDLADLLEARPAKNTKA